MESKQHQLRVLMFPWLAHGHTSPFLELAKRLTRRNIYVYFCSTPIILSSIEKQLSDDDEKRIFLASIELTELHIPSTPDLPPHYHTTTSLPLHLMPILKTSLDLAKSAFSNIIDTLKPDLLIYDIIQPWVPVVAYSYNIPAIAFSVFGAATSTYIYHLCKYPQHEFPFSAINLHHRELLKITQAFNSRANDLTDTDRFLQSLDRSSQIVLCKTFREIEAKYIDFFPHLSGKELVGVGPLIQEPNYKDKQSKFFKWLSQKDQASVVFASFGTEYYLSKEEMEELAYGLELSGVNFIWIVRFPKGEKTSLEEVLPQEFLERVGEKGMVVDDWAPQSKILEHPSTGGFVSHCGSSSVMEGMKFGLPFIAIPMHLDQPVNAKLVVELGVGVEVGKDESGRIMRGEVERVIKEVMVEKQGEQIRRNARELGEKMRKKGEEDIDVVVERLMHICEKNV